MPRSLPRGFYERDTAEVARDLLGKLLVHHCDEGVVSGIVVETEAYLGENDPGSHASRGKTARNSVMFGRAAVAYVYFTYGMHYCFNAVAKPPGKAGAVLIRAVEPSEGIEVMRRRRGRFDVTDLASGPAKLTQAFGIDRRHNGLDLTGDTLYFSKGEPRPLRIGVSGRVGLSRAGELPLRFFIADSPFVSTRNRNRDTIYFS